MKLTLLAIAQAGRSSAIRLTPVTTKIAEGARSLTVRLKPDITEDRSRRTVRQRSG
jgi:hypothetical protein